MVDKGPSNFLANFIHFIEERWPSVESTIASGTAGKDAALRARGGVPGNTLKNLYRRYDRLQYRVCPPAVQKKSRPGPTTVS